MPSLVSSSRIPDWRRIQFNFGVCSKEIMKLSSQINVPVLYLQIIDCVELCHYSVCQQQSVFQQDLSYYSQRALYACAWSRSHNSRCLNRTSNSSFIVTAGKLSPACMQLLGLVQQGLWYHCIGHVCFQVFIGVTGSNKSFISGKLIMCWQQQVKFVKFTDSACDHRLSCTHRVTMCMHFVYILSKIYRCCVFVYGQFSILSCRQSSSSVQCLCALHCALRSTGRSFFHRPADGHLRTVKECVEYFDSITLQEMQ